MDDDDCQDNSNVEEERIQKLHQLKKELSLVTVALKKTIKKGATNEELSACKTDLEDKIYNLLDSNQKLAWTKEKIGNIQAELCKVELYTNPSLEEKLKALKDQEACLRQDGAIGNAVSLGDNSVLVPPTPNTNNPPDGQGFVQWDLGLRPQRRKISPGKGQYTAA